MASFGVSDWLRVQNLEYAATKLKFAGYDSYQKVSRLTRDAIRQLGLDYVSQEERLFRAVSKLKSQGEEEASRVVAQDLLVGVQN